MTGPIFCKFDHECTLQASGSRIRFFHGGHDAGAFDYELHRNVVVSAVNLYEGVVHLLTTDGVYEVTADQRVGVVFQRIGPELP